MAFLLPLAEIGATLATGIGEVGTAVGLSEGAAQTLAATGSSAAVGYLGSQANNAANSLVQELTGKTVSQWEVSAKENLSQNYSQANDFLNGTYTPKEFKRTKASDIASYNDALRNNQLNLDSQLYTNAINDIKSTVASTTINSPNSNITNSSNTIEQSPYTTPYATNNTQPDQSIIVDQRTFEKLFGKQTQYPVNSGFSENSLQALPSPPTVGKDEGQILGQILGKTMVSSDPNTMVQEMIKNPNSTPILKQFIDFSDTNKGPIDARKDPEYAEIFRIYNGRNCSAFVNSVGHFCFKNETGQVEEYTGTTAPLNSDGTQLSTTQIISAGFIPPIYGTWTGPNSPNNLLPISINSNITPGLLDLYSLSHDISYQNGWFDKRGDLIYISRVSQNLSRMSFRERIIAEFAIKWFTQASYLLGSIKGSLGLNSSQTAPDGNPNKVMEVSMSQNIDNTDLYQFIIKNSAKQYNPQITSGYNRNASVPIVVDPVKRDDFYSGLFNGLNDVYSQSMVGSSSSINNNGLPLIFDQLQIIDYSE